MTDYLDDIPFDETNPEPRCPCLLLLNVSAAMAGRPSDEFNAGIMAFREELPRDDLAALRVEVAITTIGEAIKLGLDELEVRKKLYHSRG